MFNLFKKKKDKIREIKKIEGAVDGIIYYPDLIKVSVALEFAT